MEWILIGICAALALCPPRYDPAIRLKEAGYSWRTFVRIYGRK